MKITLDLVRNTLRQALGRESFIASLITRVEETTSCPTACITQEGQLYVNPDFVGTYVSSEQDLACLLIHEIMHPLFGHFVYGPGELENLGADMVINATISQVFAQASGNGSLFCKFYEPTGLQGLLRPGSRMADSRYAGLYAAFYGSGHHGGATLSTGEVIHTLKILTPATAICAIPLMGSHGAAPETGSLSGLSAERRCAIAEDLKNAAQHAMRNRAGYNESLHSLFLEVLKSHLSMKRALLARFATRQKLDHFRVFAQQRRTTTSPIPLHPSKRDLILLSAGIVPFHYHNHIQTQTARRHGLAVYLDVSGSVNQHLPHIIGVLRSLKGELTTVFLFSNQVVETPFATLLSGCLQTTHGTDFNCIAASILERGYDKAVILTDGYAHLNTELAAQLHKQRVRTLTVLFGGKQDCPEFQPLGDVAQLEDLVH